MSTFKGLFQEIPHISVDKFNEENLRSTAYFLSHAHTDHMEGLEDGEFYRRLRKAETEQIPVFLYCSRITRLYLMNRNMERLDKYIKILELGTSMIEVHSPLGKNHVSLLAVSCIPAGHCPGSVMFLFESETCNVLYTGDFRITSSDLTKFSSLCTEDGMKKIHALYLDTTFLDQSYYHFPSRAESAATLCDVVQDWVSKSSEHLVMLELPARCGSEYLYTKLRKHLGFQVHVQPFTYRQYEGIEEIRSCLTSDAESTAVHACCKRDEIRNMSIPCRRGNFHVLIIKPSAMWYRTTEKEKKQLFRYNSERSFCNVVHSCHASYKELRDVVNILKPLKINPTAIPSWSTRKKVIGTLNKLMKESDNLPSGSEDSNVADAERESEATNFDLMIDSAEYKFKSSLQAL